MLTRRHVIASALAAPAVLRLGVGTARAATALKISHQFPGGTIEKGDFRDRLCRMFAAEVAKRSGGEITAEVYPNSSLIKTNAQFAAMRKGALDISLYPMPYAGGELPETNIGLMPGLVATYNQGLRWKKELKSKEENEANKQTDRKNGKEEEVVSLPSKDRPLEIVLQFHRIPSEELKPSQDSRSEQVSQIHRIAINKLID